MRHVFRCVMVLTISLSLVASAAAWRPCSGLQLAGAAAAGAGHGYHTTMHRADAAGHGVHDHHGMTMQHAADDTAAADDSGSMKCCSMCTVATALLPAVNADATFIVSAHLFSRDQDARSGKNVAVDPGIPKTIV